MADFYYIHIFNKSISHYGIFTKDMDCHRFLVTLSFYNNIHLPCSLSYYLKKNPDYTPSPFQYNHESVYSLLSYCIMPDHYHLLIKIEDKKMISKYISKIENSYTRYFNLKHNRKGPLWQNRFKYTMIKNQNEFSHVSRYIHLNPTTNHLVDRPEKWPFSSYKDFFDNPELFYSIDEFSNTTFSSYQQFIENNIDYQRSIKRIKKRIIE